MRITCNGCNNYPDSHSHAFQRGDEFHSYDHVDQSLQVPVQTPILYRFADMFGANFRTG